MPKLRSIKIEIQLKLKVRGDEPPLSLTVEGTFRHFLNWILRDDLALMKGTSRGSGMAVGNQGRGNHEPVAG